jgi:hypothetical protein
MSAILSQKFARLVFITIAIGLAINVSTGTKTTQAVSNVSFGDANAWLVGDTCAESQIEVHFSLATDTVDFTGDLIGNGFRTGI